MSRGVILFAHNNENTDYFRMAVYTAKRIYQYLNLPVSVITDQESMTCTHDFDRVIFQEPDRENKRKKHSWINKGRYQAWELTPYTETLLLDTDYMVNSHKLNDVWSYPSDIMCYKSCKYLLENQESEQISPYSYSTYWATVIKFTQTNKTQQIFSMMKMIQQNYQHYANLHGFVGGTFRNDYALTLALNTVNGHVIEQENFIPGKLLHVNLPIQIQRLDDAVYKVLHTDRSGKTTYLIVKNLDFHMLSKQNFQALMA